jgi:hypothetical protein
MPLPAATRVPRAMVGASPTWRLVDRDGCQLWRPLALRDR